MPKPKSKPAASRADPPMYDFNRTEHEKAAAAVTQDQLETLFVKLDRADELFDRERETPRKAAIAALSAVIDLLFSNPTNRNGRFSRPIELLVTELGSREPALAGQILPRPPAGQSAATKDAPRHHAIGAAVFAAELLFKTGLSLDEACAATAKQLAESGFKFARRRTSGAGAVKAWRRDINRKNNAPAAAYRFYVANTPQQSTGNVQGDRDAIIAWLKALLARAGYGPVV